MKLELLLVILFNTMLCFSQSYVVEKVQLTESLENKYVSDIPKLKDLSNDTNPVVDVINSRILDRFMINSFVQSELEDEFRWYEVECSSEIKDSILYISFAGEYYGAYPNYVADEMFFDLTSGEPLNATQIPFQALFTLSGYLDFLNTYWLEGVKAEFTTAIECAEMEPYCSYYDIDFTVDNNKLAVSLTYDCYPHVAQGCSPVYNISVELDSMKPYLNPIGKYMLLARNYMNLTPVGKFLENEKLMEKVPNNVFLFGNLGDRYPISMAINVDNQEDISGFYFYNSKLQQIAVKGQIKADTLFLTETVNHQQTGFFEFDLNVDQIPIDGKWLNAGNTKSLDVKFDKILTCKNN